MPGNVRYEMRLNPFRMFLYLFLVAFITMLFVGYTMLSSESFDDGDPSMPEFHDPHEDDTAALKEQIYSPIILWWTPFTGEKGSYKKCKDNTCFFTVDRHYLNHKQTKVLMFYGSDLDIKELPIPRQRHHEWALLHEESPKNEYILTQPEFLTLFNHTSTFKRESDFPLTLQYLESEEWLLSTKYLVRTREKNKLQRDLAPIMYVQSDCNVPSDRDHFVEKFMKYMKVDSYGSCLHNIDLPKHLVDPIQGMDHEDFFRLQANYKFSFAMENAICDDYITEKVWRPLMLGSVPVIKGSPRIRDILPDNHSAIIIDDFSSPKQLADYLERLNKNDREYDEYLKWKKTGITNKVLKKLMEERSWSIVETWLGGRTNFVDDFECFVCDRVYQNLRRKQNGQEEIEFIADKSHLECPEPKQLRDEQDENFLWKHEFEQKSAMAAAVRYFADRNIAASRGEFHAKFVAILHKKKGSWL